MFATTNCCLQKLYKIYCTILYNMWNSLLFSIFIIQCSSCIIPIKPFQLHFQHWKNSTFQKINWPKKWFIIPHELQPYEIEFFIVI